MNQDGYTLAETLAALAMIGLAIGGLTAGVRVIGLNQAAATRHLADGHSLGGAEQVLSRLFAGQGPFQSSDAGGLRADGRRLSFTCADASPCSASLDSGGLGERLSVVKGRETEVAILPGVRSARFAYAGTQTLARVWPPASKDPEDLRSVLILDGSGANEVPIVIARLWREQPVTCAFDPIRQNCRAAAQ